MNKMVGTIEDTMAVVLILRYDPITFIIKKPKIQVTEQLEPSSPRTSGSAISPIYMGTAVKDTPSAIPAIKRAM